MPNSPSKPTTNQLIEEAVERLEVFIKDYIWLKDNPGNRKSFKDDNWYSKDGKEDPLRTVVSHVGIDQLRKLVRKELSTIANKSAEEERNEWIDKIRKRELLEADKLFPPKLMPPKSKEPHV